jgi:hypothetical protein
MVAVPGFPRPLYPADAVSEGKTPSANGPDVEAYKRTCWRAGRWPGPASNFDRAFSNAFSHGKPGSGNVVDSGIAGVQRQQKIEATGWIGQQTFNTLRSIRVPDGPHQGEMAMDANAANLIAQAWQLYGGKEPEPPSEPVPPGKTTRQRALEAAISYLGYKENPAGSNNTKFGEWYDGANYQPWCATFVTYCFEVEAGGSPSFDKTQARYAYVPYVVSDGRNNRFGLSIPSSVMPGDLVTYNWDGGPDGTYDHIGIFEAWTGGSSFTAIEGNTSVSNNSNGGEVMRRQRSATAQTTTFIRVA